MLETIIHWDHQIFLWINHINHPWLDMSLPILTDLHQHTSLIIILLTLLLWTLLKQRRVFYSLLFLILVLAINDFVGGQIKDLFARYRPDRAGLDVILRAPHYNGGSFPSNHAMNMFCFASYVGRLKSQLFIPLILIAATIAFSRVYCGVHFPLDVLFGGVMGYLMGKYSYWLFSKKIFR